LDTGAKPARSEAFSASFIPTTAPMKIPALFAFALFTASALSAADIDGKWKAEFDSQVGPQKLFLELKAEGEKLTGKATADRGAQFGKTETAITNGKIVKDEVSFSEQVKIQDNEITIEYKGKIVGDELKLHRKVGDFAEYDIVAKREKAEKK
jgi:hypothetical protein